MPQDYTVIKATPAEQWSNDYGTYQPYDLILEGHSGQVQLNRKLKDGAVPEDKVPKEGQTLYLSINGTKAKEERREDAPQSAPRTDATGQSIEAQVAAKCAAEVLATGKLEINPDNIKNVTASFYAAIQSAKA